MPRKSPKLTIRQRIAKHIPELLIGLGMFLLLLNAVHSVFRDRSLSLDQATAAAYVEPSETRPPKPAKIFIKWFVDVPVTPAVFTGQKWTVSAETASYLLQSARPGENGNIIIYGHNTRAILGNIRALKGGETVVLTTEDGQEHRYVVESLHEVEPTKTELVQPTDFEVLTIYTCSGLLGKQRFIVRARPL